MQLSVGHIRKTNVIGPLRNQEKKRQDSYHGNTACEVMFSLMASLRMNEYVEMLYNRHGKGCNAKGRSNSRG